VLLMGGNQIFSLFSPADILRREKSLSRIPSLGTSCEPADRSKSLNYHFTINNFIVGNKLDTKQNFILVHHEQTTAVK